MTTPIIEKNIPVPGKNVGPRTVYSLLFKKMGIGDSVFVPREERSVSANGVRLLTNAKYAAPTFKFTIRSVTENDIPGTRIWRIE